MQPESNKGYVLLIYFALVLTTMAVYWRAHDFEFVTLDDLAYAGQNKQVLNGLTWEGTIWAFTTEAQSNWDPLTWLSLKPDCQLFEAEAGASHITNVLFHIANTLLLFAVLK